MQENNKVYSSQVSDKIEELSGFKTDDWQQCFRTNSTYLDCPVNQVATNKTWTMNVAVHNPSTLDLSTAKIAVPPGEYSATAFDDLTQTFVYADSTLICFEDRDEKGN